MAPRHLSLIVLDGAFAVCRLAPDAPMPPWAMAGSFLSITRTSDELSIVCDRSLVPEGVQCESDWRCLRVAGALAFSEIGVLAALVGPLADAGISVFALSTFDTDYLLLKEADREQAIAVLRLAGHTVR
jgi:hypothetical protein